MENVEIHEFMMFIINDILNDSAAEQVQNFQDDLNILFCEVFFLENNAILLFLVL